MNTKKNANLALKINVLTLLVMIVVVARLFSVIYSLAARQFWSPPHRSKLKYLNDWMNCQVQTCTNGSYCLWWSPDFPLSTTSRFSRGATQSCFDDTFFQQGQLYLTMTVIESKRSPSEGMKNGKKTTNLPVMFPPSEEPVETLM